MACGAGEFSSAGGRRPIAFHFFGQRRAGERRIAALKFARHPDVMEKSLHRARPPGIEQKQLQPRFAGAGIHPGQFFRHALAQQQLVGRALHLLPIGRISLAGIEILALQALSRASTIASPKSALSRRMAMRSRLSLRAARAGVLIADGALAQGFQAFERVMALRLDYPAMGGKPI